MRLTCLKVRDIYRFHHGWNCCDPLKRIITLTRVRDWDCDGGRRGLETPRQLLGTALTVLPDYAGNLARQRWRPMAPRRLRWQRRGWPCDSMSVSFRGFRP